MRQIKFKTIKSSAIFFIVFFAVLITKNVYAESDKKLSEYDIVQQFINRMVTQYNFDQKYLTKLFNHTELSQDVINKINHPYEKKPWYIYKQNFLTQKRIDDGVKYWIKHWNALAYAQKEYGVPANIIVAIVGVETLYGETELKYPVLNSLATLSFAYPKRSRFFTQELEEYLLLTRELDLNPASVKGSYAGALGLPQFMPSNYRRFAVSYQNKNTKDLLHDTDDVIVSIANFLNYFGWEENGLIAIPAKVKGNKYEKLLSNSLKPKLTIAQLRKYNVKPIKRINPRQRAVLFELEDADIYEYWLGFDNFSVLSNYNNDKQYILTVYLLAEKIKQKMISSSF